jgi:hypothetical protein
MFYRLDGPGSITGISRFSFVPFSYTGTESVFKFKEGRKGGKRCVNTRIQKAYGSAVQKVRKLVAIWNERVMSLTDGHN